MTGRGQLEDEGGGTVTLRFQREYPHAVEHVWAAIATPEGLGAWLLATEVEIDGRPGGTIAMVSGPGRYRSRGRILRWEPPRVLEYEWNVAPVPEMPQGERAIFCYELSPRAEGTALVVTYRRLTRQTATGFLPGLHALLDRLAAQLGGAPLPDWSARFAELTRTYPEWTEHAAPAAE